jgi:hypothetical protein
MAFQILSAVSLLTIMDTFLERMDTVRPKKAMYFGDVSLITSSNVGLEPKRSMMNQSITAEYIIMILQMQMYLTFSEIQWGFPVFLAIQAKFEIYKPFLLLLTAVLVQKIRGSKTHTYLLDSSNYVYVVAAQNKTDRIYWRCKERITKCKGRCVTTGNSVSQVSGFHNHGPNFEPEGMIAIPWQSQLADYNYIQ